MGHGIFVSLSNRVGEQPFPSRYLLDERPSDRWCFIFVTPGLITSPLVISTYVNIY